MKLKKCVECKKYTLKEICSKCNEKTKDAHYKFVKLRDVKENSSEISQN
ncbi:MAG: nucleolar RNA-binding Nop10p family protein [archaeon]